MSERYGEHLDTTVCAWCRKIKDQDGQWSDCDWHLRDAGLEVTHGICEECIAIVRQQVSEITYRKVD